MKVLITGATGLIGSEIVKLCHDKGFEVHYLTTSKRKIVTEDNFKGFYWSPSTGEIDENCFEEVEYIINLVGASISKRWTKSYKEEIINSRIDSLKLLNASLKKLPSNTVKSFVSASAIGIYPNSLSNYYETDEEGIDASFLGTVTSKWEKAIDELKMNGFPVAKIRIGLVLSTQGGALPEIVKPVKYGLGAAFGTGEQWQSWIHIKDLSAMFLYILEHTMEGVFNGVAPNPVTNSKLTKEIASLLKRPLFLPNIPKNIMTLILGEMAYLLFASQRVSSKKIQNLGFQFQHQSIRSALESLMMKKNNFQNELA